MIDTTPAKMPERITIPGRYVTLVPLNAAAHGDALWDAVKGEQNDALWLYLFDGPYRERSTFDASLQSKETSPDPFFYAITDNATGKATGMASLMRIDPKHRVIEVGSILYSPLLQRTRGATEAMYLLMHYAFDTLGNRRYEWKCNALNEPSRRAALRLGFTFEGIFRQHMIAKGLNRDTAWFSIIDSEWPALKQAFEKWLAPDNFTPTGTQLTPLAAIRTQEKGGHSGLL
jgi:RimJ/RimL family protein N-acetyltransferase